MNTNKVILLFLALCVCSTVFMVDAKAGAIPGPNLAIAPLDWGNYATNYGQWIGYGSGTQIVFLSTSVEHTSGNPSIWFEYPHTSADMNQYRECDGAWYAIKPGDHIVAKCWMKLTASGVSPPDKSPYAGARIGIDFYDSNIIPFDTFWQNYWSGDPTHSYVYWGSDWNQKIIDIIVPATDVGTGRVPTSFVMWMQVWSSTYGASDPGQAWFADAELYINPTTTSTPTPTTYALTVAGSTGGTTSLPAGSYTYTAGTVVLVKALPNQGYTFSKWILDGVNQGSSLSINVTMNANHKLQAVYVRSAYNRYHRIR